MHPVRLPLGPLTGPSCHDSLTEAGPHLRDLVLGAALLWPAEPPGSGAFQPISGPLELPDTPSLPTPKAHN
uniref:Uncharacterized protein n=1 Tax=Panthera leo TaxID=9689 RepID=A0A8C8XF09_PANLE